MLNREVQKTDLSLILVLGAIALIRPLSKITGIIDIFGNRARGSLLMTLIVSGIWIFIVVKNKFENPVSTLVYAGLSYGVFSIILSGILSPILTGRLQGPLVFPPAIFIILILNIIWGFITGVIAKLFLGNRI
ncbi:hypothetical protein [Clostridium isatidis]|uniref:hypothetical protein n=1 Tax=Clostridium isatidis TaxID=182773 RepID=UPI003AACFF0E